MILYYKYNTFPANRQPSITNLPSLSPPSPAPSPIADNSVPVSGCGNIGVHFARAHAPSPGNGRTPSGGRWRRHGLVIPAADCHPDGLDSTSTVCGGWYPRTRKRLARRTDPNDPRWGIPRRTPHESKGSDPSFAVRSLRLKGEISPWWNAKTLKKH